jgi:hypothetical protein
MAQDTPDFTKGSITHESKYGRVELEGVYLWAAALLVLLMVMG